MPCRAWLNSSTVYLNVHAGALRKATSTLVARYDAIVVEDLNIAGIIRNRHLAPACGKRGC
jgi:transposase